MTNLQIVLLMFAVIIAGAVVYVFIKSVRNIFKSQDDPELIKAEERARHQHEQMTDPTASTIYLRFAQFVDMMNLSEDDAQQLLANMENFEVQSHILELICCMAKRKKPYVYRRPVIQRYAAAAE